MSVDAIDVIDITIAIPSLRSFQVYWLAAPKIDKFPQKLVDFTFSLFTLHFSLKPLSIFGGSNK